MEFAVQWVPEQKDMDYVGMVNKGACRMLLSKLYMSIGEFGKAKEQLDILIDKSGYSLMEPSLKVANLHHGLLPAMLSGIYIVRRTS